MFTDRGRTRALVRWALACVAPWVVVACAYDFDQFVNAAGGAAPTGGAQANGGGATTSSASGGKASSNGGSNSSGGTGSTSSSATTACAGTSYLSMCWYLGNAGASCDQVCATHGQTATNAATVIGTSTQGGSLAECAAVLSRLGVTQGPIMGTRTDGIGLGCHVFNNVPWWLSSPAFSASASNANARIACGCTR